MTAVDLEVAICSIICKCVLQAFFFSFPELVCEKILVLCPSAVQSTNISTTEKKVLLKVTLWKGGVAINDPLLWSV